MPARERPSGRLILCHAVLCVAATVASAALGQGYRARMSDPRGFYQVTVPDAVPAEAARGLARPRRAVVVVFDGLGLPDARRVPSILRLGEAGRCLRTDVGPLSLSRPVYATLSTGLEADRAGCRDNGAAAPLDAQPLWQLARRAGLRVSAVSELPWWRELFPQGFDDYRVGPREEDFLRAAPPGDLQLIHPLYLDETAHEHGAASPAFEAALRRADGELAALLARVDLSRDLVLVTADHGHTARGGHGGRQPRVAEVLTCLAGPGVRRAGPEGAAASAATRSAASTAAPTDAGAATALEPLPSTAVAPLLALLLGLPFPAQMRAGDDGLDALLRIVDGARLPAAYLADRAAALGRFRAENAAQLRAWDPASGGSWRAFYARARAAQRLRMAPAVLALLLVALCLFRAQPPELGQGPDRRRAALFGLAFVASVLLAGAALQVALRGSFDLSAVSGRGPFIRFTLALGAGVGLVAAAAHLALRRSAAALLRDGAALMAAALVLCLAHPLVYGYRLGFPLPPPAAYFFPFFATLFLPPLSALGLLGCAAAALRGRAGR